MKNLKTTHIALIAILIAVAAIVGGTYVNNRMDDKKMDSMNEQAQNRSTLDFLSTTTPRANQPTSLEFAIQDKDGTRLNESAFSIEHEKRMHVIVVSKDLSQFQHVHPRFDDGTKTFKLDNFTFPSDGNYRIFADYVMGEREPIVYQDVAVGNVASYSPQPLGQPNSVSMADGNQIDLAIQAGDSGVEKVLEFSLSRDGKTITDLENYLGALGHLVVLHEGDLEYIHTHALTTDLQNQTGKVKFAVDFKKAGTYKAFAQFQRGGKVMTVSYVITITGEDAPNTDSGESHSDGH